MFQVHSVFSLSAVGDQGFNQELKVSIFLGAMGEGVKGEASGYSILNRGADFSFLTLALAPVL